jgi:hypothetical protein
MIFKNSQGDREKNQEVKLSGDVFRPIAHCELTDKQPKSPAQDIHSLSGSPSSRLS